jgi:anti-anti-sigma factor
MEVTFVPNEGYVLAQTSGPINDAARDVFQQQLHPLVADGTRLILDLAGSERIDSQGVSNLVTLVAHANTSSSRVIFCNLQPYVATVLSVTKLDKFFDIAPTLDEAVERATGTKNAIVVAEA